MFKLKAIVAFGVLVAAIIATLFVLVDRPLDRKQLAAWVHHWQHDGTDVSVNVAAVIDQWQRQQQAAVRESMVSAIEPLRLVPVNDEATLLAAIRSAQPGDRILLAPGQYAFSGKSIAIKAPAQVDHPITIAAAEPWQSVLRFNLIEGFWVNAPYWQFEGLVIEGSCENDNRCEHAFHVVGEGKSTGIAHNRITDFNAAIKINANRAGVTPDFGVIENNFIGNGRPRQTRKSVVGVDGVAVNNWRVAGNVIANFQKAKGDKISSGAFFKGGGSFNRFERNLVMCADRVSMDYVQIGLSLGNGGTYAAACRGGRCQYEQSDSDIVGNLIVNCSDVGVYLNRAARSTIANNTLYSTLGIDVRFTESSAVIANNLLSGRIKERDGGDITLAQSNRRLSVDSLWGQSFSRVFRAPEKLDFSLRRSEQNVAMQGVDNRDYLSDICGVKPTNGDLKGFVGAFDLHSDNQCFAIE
tara:strand:- start:841 stop:2244 length:1404 start_codon:yes stop_codon:yes gene_type:complete